MRDTPKFVDHQHLPTFKDGLRIWLTVVAGFFLVSGGNVSAAEVDFMRDVRPILSHHCFACHGPDDAAREADLRLDRRSDALESGKAESPPIVPGKPEESELVRRIFASDDDVRMPPPKAKNPLDDEQKAILKQWVAAGAKYEDHWSFVPPKQAPLPEVNDAAWPENPIDYFVLNRLEEEHLEPSPRADRYTLVRRLYLDLIGLPPTPEQADAFVKDASPDAYTRLVDRLLASPHYGERWGRRWLDLARYADTNGYEKDRPRSIWPYRDWVIDAINDDMPFDQFTIEQIAGDMLPNPTPDQKIATGFHRNTMLNEEGGIDPLEFRFYSMVDRVHVTSTAWLGLTMKCAQCHTHKFDPISQRDYYQFMAFLNNAEEPTMKVPDDNVRKQRTALKEKIAALEADLTNQYPPAPDADGNLKEQRRRHLEQDFTDWIRKEAGRQVDWTPLVPTDLTSSGPLLTLQEDASIFAQGDFTKQDTYTLQFEPSKSGITAIRLEVLPDPRLPNHGPGTVYYEGPKGDFWLSNFQVRADSEPITIASATESFANGENNAAQALDDDLQSGWSVNGGQGKTHNAVFLLERPLADMETFELEMLFERYYAAGLGRFRIWVTTDPDPGPAQALPNEVRDLLREAGSHIATESTTRQSPKGLLGRLPQDVRQGLLDYFVRIAPDLKEAREKIAALRKQMPEYPTTLVMRERPPEHPRPTFIHNRGEFLQPTEKVEPAVPNILSSLPDDVPRNRLGFARWLVSRNNPLTARVVVNRHWEGLFGTGLVKTVEDFGTQGEYPSHPKLLDWLAVEFMQRDWSIKALHRLIVTSATYRQSAAADPDLLARDPNNRLLARGPRFRLEAELIRDAALTASDLLSHKVGGPSVFPPQPPGVTTEGAFGKLNWEVSEGADRYRRGLYTFAKRTTPYAMFSTFDAPSGEACVARRERSNTPLQGLTLLNDKVFMETAKALGRLTVRKASTRQERLHFVFRRCLTRPPDPKERQKILAFYEAQHKRLSTDELNASEIAGRPVNGVPLTEQAAWTAVARVLLNLDEAITSP